MQTCSICKSKDRELIDRAIVEGGSLRDISSKYRVSKSAVDRHKAHITALVQSSTQDTVQTLQFDIAKSEGRLEKLFEIAEATLQGAVAQKNGPAVMAGVKTTLKVLGEIRALAELKGTAQPIYEARDIDQDIEDLLLGRPRRAGSQNRTVVLADLDDVKGIQ